MTRMVSFRLASDGRRGMCVETQRFGEEPATLCQCDPDSISMQDRVLPQHRQYGRPEPQGQRSPSTTRRFRAEPRRKSPTKGGSSGARASSRYRKGRSTRHRRKSASRSETGSFAGMPVFRTSFQASAIRSKTASRSAREPNRPRPRLERYRPTWMDLKAWKSSSSRVGLRRIPYSFTQRS